MTKDHIKVLEVINKNSKVSQKSIGQLCDLSTGKVNYIIKGLLDEGYLESEKRGRSVHYFLTESGLDFLSKTIEQNQDKKIIIHVDRYKKINQAVILAAGETEDFHMPVSLLPLDEINLLQRNIAILKKNGISNIIIVVGYKQEEFASLQDMEGVQIVSNPRYQWTGSMASLACAKEFITDDFLLLEHDILIEERAIKSLIEQNQRDCMFISNETGSDNEAFVELRNNYIFKISKDIHQLNRIDGEMVGISKLSYEVYRKMLEEYKHNRNPFLNYEYLLLDVSRKYKIGYLKINDLVWSGINTKEHYLRVLNSVYPKLKRKEAQYKENELKEVTANALQIDPQHIQSIEPFGGMTNKNYKIVLTNEKQYVLRIPGAGTESIVNRLNEKKNISLASSLGIDSKLKYFNEVTGVKISKLIPNAETLNPKTSKWEVNMELTTDILRKLHTSNIKMENTFDIGKMMKQYERLIERENGTMYPDFSFLKEKVLKIKDIYDDMNIPLKPCHNDTVAENFVKSGDRKIYLIDWEYAGMNDPIWDLAAHCLENEFTEKEEQLFLSLYFPKGVSKEIQTRMLIHKIFQDYIWSLWTVYKEAKGDNFGDYGKKRHYRAIKHTKEFISRGVYV